MPIARLNIFSKYQLFCVVVSKCRQWLALVWMAYIHTVGGTYSVGRVEMDRSRKRGSDDSWLKPNICGLLESKVSKISLWKRLSWGEQNFLPEQVCYQLLPNWMLRACFISCLTTMHPWSNHVTSKKAANIKTKEKWEGPLLNKRDFNNLRLIEISRICSTNPEV